MELSRSWRPKNWPGLVTGYMRRFLLQKDQGFQTLEEYIFEEGADFMHEEDIEWLRGKGIFLKAYGYKLEEDMDTKHEDFFAIPVKDWRDFVGRTDV